MTLIETPCIKICVLDTASGLCNGCGRSSDEIANWIRLDDEERRRIMNLAKTRLAAMPRKRQA